MRCRRGFTLVEVLVALGLLVLIASLALPVALTNTTDARARTAERILKLAPAVARGEAQSRGLPVALMLRPSEDGTELSLELVRQPDPQGESAQDLEADPEDISTWPTVDEPKALPRGTKLWDGEMAELEAFEAAAEEASEAVGQGGGMPPLGAFTEDESEAAPEGIAVEPADPVVLAWFLSDGSAMAGEATVVQLADGRVLRVRVEALTGRLEFTRAPELEEADEEEADEATDDGDQPAGSEEEQAEGDEPSEAEANESRTFDELEFEQPEFEQLEFEQLEFEPLEFEDLEFEDLGSRFDRGSGRESSRDPESQPESESTRERTNPQPPQPR